MSVDHDPHITSPPPHKTHWHLTLAIDEGESYEGIEYAKMIVYSYFEHLGIVENIISDREMEICVPWYDKVFMPPTLENIEVALLRKGYRVRITAREVEQCQMRTI